MSRSFVQLIRSPWSLAGAVLTTTSAVLILTLALLGAVGFEGGAYLGILAYLILPVFFLLGLALIPFGMWRERRRVARARAAGALPPQPSVLDLSQPRTQRRVLLFAALTTANVVIVSLATFKAVHLMDTPAFCGSCHSVIGPEFATHQRSPHARVACVDCHIGSGATWYVKAKLSGTIELLHTVTGNYPRPLPVPVHSLRPARATCETCHWPSKFEGTRLVVRTSFADDEANTPQKTVLLMHIGGGSGPRGQGIHYHVAEGVRIRYLADPALSSVGVVELTRHDKSHQTFVSSDGPSQPGPKAVWRTMDCIDCHNRPSHIYVTAEKALDDAIQDGRVPRSLPFIHREGLKLLGAQYPSEQAAREAIRKGLSTFYTQRAPGSSGSTQAIEAAATYLGDLWAQNVWPGMKITWGTYPSFIGHSQAPGCFRCHDGNHSSRDGKSTISNDCGLCHTLLSQDEPDPKILHELQMLDEPSR